MKILLAILLGGFFGFALYKVQATDPKKLTAMLRLEDLHLAKVILFAIGFSSVLLSISYWTGIFDVGHLNVKTLNLGVILGGIIFGIGFGYAGTCPGTCVGASSTSNYKKGLSTILGGLIGAFTFTILYPYLNNLGLISGFDLGKITLFNISENYPSVFSIGYMGLFIVGIIFMVGGYLLPKTIIKR